MLRHTPAALGLAASLALGACQQFVPAAPPPVNEPEPQLIEEPPVTEPSARSRVLAEYYQRVQAGLLTQGLLRTDAGGPDAPFTENDLVENFVRIALYEEYAPVAGQLIPKQTPSRLHRWEEPVRMGVRFGTSVPQDVRDRDRMAVGQFAQRLSRTTGLPMRLVRRDANFHIFVVNDDELKALGPELRRLLPDISDAAVNTVARLPRSSYCLVFAADDGKGAYNRAVAVIRAEHPDLLRLSCIHEELAQGLGLANDSPAARPSIFNDDEEYALLTRHDEYLLMMLYDPRMRPGMRESEARPIARMIAADLIGGSS